MARTLAAIAAYLALSTLLTVPASAAEPWTLETPRTVNAKGPKLLIVHDMEGLSGQDSIESIFFQFDEYAEAQKLLAADINAAVDGFFAGGAAEVHIADGHGSGNPGPDLPSELLDRRATQLIRSTPFDPYIGIVAEDQYDAVAMVGAHARTGTNGFAPHTLTLGMDVYFNHTPVCETEFLALSWGRKNIPLIFASGDDVFADLLAETMPWTEVAVTKFATGAATARLIPLEIARKEIRTKAMRSIEKLDMAKAMKLSLPVTVTLRTVPPADLSAMRNVRGITYSEPGKASQDAAVTFSSDNWDDAIRGLFGLVAVARGGYLRHTIEQYEREGQHRKFDEFYEKRMRVWIDQESGKLKPSPVENHGRPLPEKHHGIR